MALRRLPAGALVALAALLFAGAGALLGPARTPDPGRETTLWLAVESLAKDGDLAHDAADRARYRERFGADPSGVLTRSGGGAKELDAPWTWTRLATAARKLGRGGPYALQGALLGLAFGAAVVTLKSRIGLTSAALLGAVSFAGSPAFLAVTRLESFALELAAVALAAAAVWYRKLVPAEGPEQIYGGDLDARPSIARWAIAGAGYGIALAGSPAYLPLALPLVAAAPKERRSSAAALFTLFALAWLGGVVALGGSPWEPIEPIVSPTLWLWSAIGLLAGRFVGILPYFTPLVLIAANSGRSEGRRWVYLAAAAAIAVQLALAPFDFVEGAVSPGNAWFLPIYLLLLASCEQAESRALTVATLLLAAPFLAPSWLATPGATSNAVARWAARVTAPAVHLLPVASTLRRAPGAVDLTRPELVVRAFAPEIAPAADGRLRLREREGALLVVSSRPLSSVRIELGGEAPAELEVAGGEVSNTTFRPSGEVAFDVVVAKDPRRHPVWWSRDDAWIYPLRLRLPGRPPTPVALDLPFARGFADDVAPGSSGARP